MPSETTPIREYLPEIYGTGMFVGAGILSNVAQHYPALSRFPALACMGLVGYCFGYVAKQWGIRRRADEDLATWDYVAQHPQDFPELERPKKYKEVLLPWEPLR